MGGSLAEVVILEMLVSDIVFMEMVFVIFFLVVIGFMVGIVMLGDLVDFKWDIFVGIIVVIVVGFVVYIVLAIFFYSNVDLEVFWLDYNILCKILIWALVVIVGIWGVMLFFVIGGILGVFWIL